MPDTSTSQSSGTFAPFATPFPAALLPGVQTDSQRGIITQRCIWIERGYQNRFQNGTGMLTVPVLFWDDLTDEQKSQMVDEVRAGRLTALEAIPI